MASRYINLTETAKIIRSELRAAFPGVKFAVRQSKSGNYMHVSYTDGPSETAVAAVTSQFYGSGFDAQTDCSTRHDSTYNGEVVHFAGSRPSISRDISPGFERAAEAAWGALSSNERCRLLNRYDFPSWPEDRPGLRLACFISEPGAPAAR